MKKLLAFLLIAITSPVWLIKLYFYIANMFYNGFKEKMEEIE